MKFTIKPVLTLQANRKEQLRRVRWYQAFTKNGPPLNRPQPTKALCLSTIHSAYK